MVVDDAALARGVFLLVLSLAQVQFPSVVRQQ